MFVKLGRDGNNFYMYRTSVNSGPTALAWDPEVHVALDRFLALRQTIERSYVNRAGGWTGCTPVDSALIAASRSPAGTVRFAACSGGYIAYTDRESGVEG